VLGVLGTYLASFLVNLTPSNYRLGMPSWLTYVHSSRHFHHSVRYCLCQDQAGLVSW
jgi:hypothetical protein